MATTKELITQINKLFIDNDMEGFMDYLADDVVWEMHSSSSGHTTLNGKTAIGNMEPGDNMPQKIDFKFSNIVIEGHIAAVEGTGNGTTPTGKQYSSNFCDVYHFRDDKVFKLTSYVIDKTE